MTQITWPLQCSFPLSVVSLVVLLALLFLSIQTLTTYLPGPHLGPSQWGLSPAQLLGPYLLPIGSRLPKLPASQSRERTQAAFKVCPFWFGFGTPTWIHEDMSLQNLSPKSSVLACRPWYVSDSSEQKQSSVLLTHLCLTPKDMHGISWQLRKFVSCPMWVVRIQRGPSRRSGSALKSRATSLSLTLAKLKWIILDNCSLTFTSQLCTSLAVPGIYAAHASLHYHQLENIWLKTVLCLGKRKYRNSCLDMLHVFQR